MKKHNLDDKRLQRLIELTNGDDAFIREMIALFLKNTPQTMDLLNTSLINGEFSDLSDMAHKLKSSIQIIGDKKLHEIIKEIEQEAKVNPVKEKLSSSVDVLNSYIDELLNYLQNRLDNPQKFILITK